MLKLALLLCLTAGACHASEITAYHIAKAVCAVETGTILHGDGSLSGRYYVGAHGEAGPWQCTKEVAKDLGVSWGRIQRDPSYARWAFCRWYGYLLSRTGSHQEALQAYHRGLAGRHKPEAKAYASRCMNLANEFAREAK